MSFLLECLRGSGRIPVYGNRGSGYGAELLMFSMLACCPAAPVTGRCIK